jgi:outer membrane protein TolC
MNRSLFCFAAYLQLGIAILFATGCAPTQPFFKHESPDLKHYLSTATSIEYPDVEVASLAETTEAIRPLTIGNHDYEFWDLSLEECVSIALQNSKFFLTTGGTAEFRQNVNSQFFSASADQVGSIYDVAIQQGTTQSIALTVDGNGNRTLPRGVLRANQVGGVEDALAEFDAQASGFLNYGTTDRPQNVGSGNTINPQFLQATDTTQQAAISKRFATGGVATLREQVIYGSNNAQVSPISRALPSTYTAILEAQVQHPLSRNRGTLVNRIPVVLASLNEDLSIADYEIQVRNFVRDVEVAYWNLYVAYRSVSTSIIARNSAIATAQFARLNLDNGTGTVQELAQAVGQYYQFRGILEGSLAGANTPGADRFGVYGNERVLRELMGLAATDGRLVRPIEEPSLARVEFDWDECVAQALYLSPELRQKKTRIKQSELELISAKNQILPEVNLSLLYRWVGVGDDLGLFADSNPPFPATGSTALEGFTSGNFQEGAVRLDITPSAFGARRELARIRGAQLRLTREKAKLQDDERILVSLLSDAVAKTSTHYQLAQTAAQRWQAAETEVEARLAEFKNGRTPVNVVLQSQQRRAEAQIDYYRALGEYNKSINYVHYLKGTELPNSNIKLAEGPWNTKAYWDALERARERSAGKQLQYGVTRPGVVRQGPMKDGEDAMAIIGSGLNTTGQGMPPQDLMLGDPGGNTMGLDLEPYRGPVEVNDMPLGELGNKPSDLLTPTSPVDRLLPTLPKGQIEAVPAPDPSSNGDSVLEPLNDPRDSQVQPMSFSQRVGDEGYEPPPVRRTPIPSPQSLRR